MFSAEVHKANCIRMFWAFLAQVYAANNIRGVFAFANILAVPLVILSWYFVCKFIKICKSDNFKISMSSKAMMLLMFVMTVCAFLTLTNLFGLTGVTFGRFEENLLEVVHISSIGVGIFGMVIFGIREAIYNVDQKRANKN